MLRLILLCCFFQIAFFSDAPCIIDLECMECIPDNMPLVASHRASNSSVVIPVGDEVVFSCGGGRLLAYPLLSTVSAVCEAGRYRVRQDSKLRHLLELGCQENIFEDVLHTVEYCGSPLQGRAYQIIEASRNARHLATLCFDEDRGIPTLAHVSNAAANVLRMPPHSEQRSPLTLLGNFNHMFDANTRHAAEKLYSDDIRMNRRLHEIFRHEKFTFADQSLTGTKLLSSYYFDDQNMRVTDFVSNKVPVWKSVANGNLHHLHRDVAKFMKLTRPHATLDVYAGTHGVLSLRTGHTRAEIFLKPERFPVPKYIWTLVHDKRSEKALAIVVLNDPFVAVSEIRDAVFCESACGRVSWLHGLRKHRNYEIPLYGLTFCCEVQNFTSVVNEMPKEILKNVPGGNSGMLTELYA
ncbi:unnamed protein product [Colias eurytheme]|nr:unnamed protein product [Colias eurytheme]